MEAIVAHFHRLRWPFSDTTMKINLMAENGQRGARE
jgi:hypothetical protein